jgi:rhamnogalacturonan acetylesterase
MKMRTLTLPNPFAFVLVLVVFAIAMPALAATKLVLIGDSTVKNGQGQGDGGLWGWGQVLQSHFDDDQLVVENRALGGRSSRTYLTEGLWARSLDALRPGDFVLIQFGHNDGGELFKGDRPRASLKGNGEETQVGVVEMTGKAETVHSYGWYLRRYIADAKAKGATPIVLSPVPRNIWRDGRVVRASGDYGKWAREAAAEGGAPFVDLNEIVASRYEAGGQKNVPRGTFTEADHTHTTRQGAEINAECVVEGLRALPEIGLTKFLKEPEK